MNWDVWVITGINYESDNMQQFEYNYGVYNVYFWNSLWQKYYLTLGKQISVRSKEPLIGSHLSEDFVNHFNDDQAEQLLELHNAIKNPGEGSGNSAS